MYKSLLPWLDDEIKEDIRMKHYMMKKAYTKVLKYSGKCLGTFGIL